MSDRTMPRCAPETEFCVEVVDSGNFTSKSFNFKLFNYENSWNCLSKEGE